VNRIRDRHNHFCPLALTRTRGLLDDTDPPALDAMDDFALRWQESLIFAVERAAAQASSIEGE